MVLVIVWNVWRLKGVTWAHTPHTHNANLYSFLCFACITHRTLLLLDILILFTSKSMRWALNGRGCWSSRHFTRFTSRHWHRHRRQRMPRHTQFVNTNKMCARLTDICMNVLWCTLCCAADNVNPVAYPYLIYERPRMHYTTTAFDSKHLLEKSEKKESNKKWIILYGARTHTKGRTNTCAKCSTTSNYRIQCHGVRAVARPNDGKIVIAVEYQIPVVPELRWNFEYYYSHVELVVSWCINIGFIRMHRLLLDLGTAQQWHDQHNIVSDNASSELYFSICCYCMSTDKHSIFCSCSMLIHSLTWSAQFMSKNESKSNDSASSSSIRSAFDLLLDSTVGAVDGNEICNDTTHRCESCEIRANGRLHTERTTPIELECLMCVLQSENIDRFLSSTAI